MLHDAGLSHKPVGPRDKHIFPSARDDTPGAFSLDLWGPWDVRATSVYLATAQDRVTRLACAVPARAMRKPGEAEEMPGLSSKTWLRALWLAHTRLCRCGLRRVHLDNGVGLAPTVTGLPQSARYALSLGASVLYNPPGQPWRNGVLERFHWSMEVEYWREEQPSTVPEALTGLTDFLNYYNLHRPHQSLNDRAPADLAEFRELEPGHWEPAELPERLGPQRGVVEAVRLVMADGRVDTWGRQMRVSPLLAGQYVRIIFQVGDGADTGSVIWQPKKNVDVPVAEFRHKMDAPSRQVSESWELYHEVRHLEFDEDPPPNQAVDMGRLENQMARVLKRRVDLSDGARPVEEAVHETRTPNR